MKGILALSILLLLGCAAIKQAKLDATECLKDPVCRAEAVRQADLARDIAKDLSGISPIPLSSNAIGGLTYGIVLLIALVKGGRKKTEPWSLRKSITDC